MRTDAPSHEMVMSLLCSTAEKAHNQDLSALVTKVEEDPLNGTGFVKVRRNKATILGASPKRVRPPP